MAATRAQLPISTVDISISSSTGRTIEVKAGGDLQAAIDSARPGDTILLQAGATFTGNFTLPNKGSGTDYITIKSAGPLPTAGERVDEGDFGTMPTLVAKGTGPALSTEPGAHHYRIIGVEITSQPGVTKMSSLVELGDGGSAQNTVAEQPHHLILDRVYVHGTETLDIKRGIALNSSDTAIINSNISEIHSKAADSQAIGGWNGTGNYLIKNNFLEAAGENVMFGGADPHIPNALPRDIQIIGNDFYKPLDWEGKWLVKNMLELKLGERVLIEDNHFQNNWADAQNGFAVVLKSVNQDGSASWSELSDVTFRGNTITNSPGGINIAAQPEDFNAVPASRITIEDNVFENIGGDGNGRIIQLLGYGAPLKDIIIENNVGSHTAGTGGAALFFDGEATQNLVFRDNIMTHGQSGVAGSSSSEGASTISSYAPGAVFTGNVLVGAQSSKYGNYSSSNSFPTSYDMPDAPSSGGGSSGPSPAPTTPKPPTPAPTTPQNHAPTANPDSGAAGENETKLFNVLANDLDVDKGDSKTLKSLSGIQVSSPNSSIGGIDASDAFSISNGQIKFTPGTLFDKLAANETATISVTYRYEDNFKESASSTLTLKITGANEATSSPSTPSTPTPSTPTPNTPTPNTPTPTTPEPTKSPAGTAASDVLNGTAGSEVDQWLERRRQDLWQQWQRHT